MIGYWHDTIVCLSVCYAHKRGNDFSVGEAKIREKQSRQSNSKYNFMQYVFFEKGIPAYCVQWSLGQSPRSWGIFKVTFIGVSYIEKMEEQNVLVAPVHAPMVTLCIVAKRVANKLERFN